MLRFRDQIRHGGPVTLTPRESTPDQAVDVLFESLLGSRCGEILVRRLPAVRMDDAARAMIGDRNVALEGVGIRPGEKLHETLSDESEQRAATAHPMVFRLVPKNPPPSELLEIVEEMTFFAREGDDERAFNLLRRAVPNYPALESGTAPEAL